MRNAPIPIAFALLLLAGCSGAEEDVNTRTVAAARRTWKAANLKDYDLEWASTGAIEGHYLVFVRDGQVKAVREVLPNGKTVEAKPAKSRPTVRRRRPLRRDGGGAQPVGHRRPVRPRPAGTKATCSSSSPTRSSAIRRCIGERSRAAGGASPSRSSEWTHIPIRRSRPSGPDGARPFRPRRPAP